MKEMVKQLGKYRTKKKMRLNTEKSKVIEFWKGGKKKSKKRRKFRSFISKHLVGLYTLLFLGNTF